MSTNSFLGIESSKSLQFKKYKQEQRDLLKTLTHLEKEKYKAIDEDEQYFVDNIPGDGITMLSVSPQSSNRGDDDSLEDEAEREEVLRKSLYFLEVQSIPPEEEQEREAASNLAKCDKSPLALDLQGKTRRNSVQKHDERRRSSIGLLLNRPSVSSISGSNPVLDIARRRSSLDQNEVMPFYLKKKYDNQQQQQKSTRGPPRLLPRRGSVFLDNERNLYERQFMPSSADLGTVSFKSFSEGSSGLTEEKKNAIRRQSLGNIDFERKRRPESGTERINLALERIPNETIHEERSPNERRASKLVHAESTSNTTLPAWKRSFLGSRKSSIIEKRPLIANGQRRHTVGDIPRVAELTEKQNLIKISRSKSLREMSLGSSGKKREPIFDDKDVIFPAYDKDRGFTVKEFIALRKCRYLRLSKLNLQSMLWQSRHQDLIEY